MKARLKDSGKIVDVKYEYVDNVWRVTDGEPKWGRYHEKEIEFLDDKEIDWEQRRYEIAKDMLAAFMSNSSYDIYSRGEEEQVQWAVVFADALIDELKNNEQR